MAVQGGDQGQRPHGSSSSISDPTDFNFFLRSRIRDIETLRTKMGHANFVAMDTEHHDEQDFSSVGLAFASAIGPVDHPIDPAAMTGALEERDMATHQPAGASQEIGMAQSICFNIRGFERSQPTRERIWGQPDKDVDVEAIASTIMGFIQKCKEAGSGEKPLILVTYSSRAELSAISTLFPQICSLFSAWVDLQPLVLEVYHKHTDYTRLDGLNISLRYAMRTLGFCTGYQPGTLHHAGNDAVRTLAIMACLTCENVECGRLRELEHVLRVNRYRKEQRRLKGTGKDRGLLSKRPGPPSRYPYVAKIVIVPSSGIEEQQGPDHQFEVAEGDQGSERQMLLPTVDVYRPDQTWDFFSPYEPDAIGRVCREECYYVCVPSQTTLQQLITDLDGTSACSWAHVLLAEDVSDLRALGESKREERAKRRQAQEER